MSIHRRAAKRDANEPNIIKALRAYDCVVWQLSGKGIPDLLVMRKGKMWLADVKMPGKPTTTPQEELWEEAATKAHRAVFILRTPEDAVAMLNDTLPPWEPDAGTLIGKPPFAVRVKSSGYTPPRSMPRDAAKGAEVFASPECDCVGVRHSNECITQSPHT